LKVIAARRDAISMSYGDDREAQQKCDQNNEQDGMVKGWARRLMPARFGGDEIRRDAIFPWHRLRLQH
jgi:hypothetical protein